MLAQDYIIQRWISVAVGKQVSLPALPTVIVLLLLTPHTVVAFTLLLAVAIFAIPPAVTVFALCRVSSVGRFPTFGRKAAPSYFCCLVVLLFIISHLSKHPPTARAVVARRPPK